MTTAPNAPSRSEFLNLAGLFQGGMVIVALGLAWLLDVNPWDVVQWDWRAVGIAAVATLPLCALSLWLDRSTRAFARTLRDMWGQTLGPVLTESPWWELVVLALLVGLSEELLFRGVLQVWLAKWSLAGAIIVTNVAFALAHAMTPTYAVLAGAVGVYFALTMLASDPPNLLVPILCHAATDLFSFYLIRRRLQSK